MTDIKIRKWFNNLSNLEKFDVLRDGYAKKITNEYIHLLENKIEKIKEEEEGEEEEIIDDEDLLTQEIILANYDKKYEENDCHYVCIEGYIGIIHRQIKEDEIEHIIRHQTTIPQFKNRVSFFINIYKTNQLKNIFVYGRNILFISIDIAFSVVSFETVGFPLSKSPFKFSSNTISHYYLFQLVQ